jgi:inner membrane protein
MDIFTHVILGSSVGGMIAAKKIGNKAFLWGALISVIPDLDFIIMPLLETTKAMLVHRGFSHSIFFFLLIAPFLGMMIKRIEKNVVYSLAQWTSFSFFILLTQSILDVFTIYGTGFFEPFYGKRFALSSIAVLDLFFTIPLLIALIAAFRVKEWKLKKAYAWIGVFISVLYLTFTFLNKLYVQSEFEDYLLAEDIRYEKTEIFPQVGSNFMWNCIAQDRDGFWLRNMSNFSKYNEEAQLYLRNDYYMFNYLNDERIHNLQRFTRGYYSAIQRYDGSVDFRDLRYGKMGNEHDDQFVFTFKLIGDTDSLYRVERINIDFRELYDAKN